MTFVLDASVTLSWCFADEATPRSLEIRSRLTMERAIVPPLWPYEVANALTVAARRRRLTHETAAAMVQQIVSLPIDMADVVRDPTGLMQLAHEHDLSVYDAAYLQLAVTSDVPLATFDDRLVSAAQAAGVRVIGGGA
jgi:predicted nucleic acid-binding protein